MKTDGGFDSTSTPPPSHVRRSWNFGQIFDTPLCALRAFRKNRKTEDKFLSFFSLSPTRRGKQYRATLGRESDVKREEGQRIGKQGLRLATLFHGNSTCPMNSLLFGAIRKGAEGRGRCDSRATKEWQKGGREDWRKLRNEYR